MSETTEQKPSDRIVLRGPLFRRQGRRVELRDAPPVGLEPRAPVRRPAKVARMLALAHHLQRLIDDGQVSDRAALARKLGLTRARVTQLLDLLLLGPEVQIHVLNLENLNGSEPTTERALRGIAHLLDWSLQSKSWACLARHENSRGF